MKLQDTNPNQTGCCKERKPEAQHETGCCRERASKTQHETGCCREGELETQHETGCCREREPKTQHETGCCREREPKTQHETGCCGSSHSDAHHHQSLNEDDEKQFELEPSHDAGALEQLQSLLAEANDKYVRLYSEFDNFKKRAVKERMALINKANEQTLKELLFIIDDFERSITALQGEHDGLQYATQQGIKLIYDKFLSLLKKSGVKEMTLEQGSEFNSDLHEAITQKPVDDPAMKGKVIAVVEKGYLINEYVLRFAKVVIGV